MTTILSQAQPMPIELKVILWIFLGGLIIAHVVVILALCGVKVDSHFLGESVKVIFPFLFIYIFIWAIIKFIQWGYFKPRKQEPEKDDTNIFDFLNQNGKD